MVPLKTNKRTSDGPGERIVRRYRLRRRPGWEGESASAGTLSAAPCFKLLDLFWYARVAASRCEEGTHAPPRPSE